MQQADSKQAASTQAACSKHGQQAAGSKHGQQAAVASMQATDSKQADRQARGWAGKQADTQAGWHIKK